MKIETRCGIVEATVKMKGLIGCLSLVFGVGACTVFPPLPQDEPPIEEPDPPPSRAEGDVEPGDGDIVPPGGDDSHVEPGDVIVGGDDVVVEPGTPHLDVLFFVRLGPAAHGLRTVLAKQYQRVMIRLSHRGIAMRHLVAPLVPEPERVDGSTMHETRYGSSLSEEQFVALIEQTSQRETPTNTSSCESAHVLSMGNRLPWGPVDQDSFDGAVLVVFLDPVRRNHGANAPGCPELSRFFAGDGMKVDWVNDFRGESMGADKVFYLTLASGELAEDLDAAQIAVEDHKYRTGVCKKTFDPTLGEGAIVGTIQSSDMRLYQPWMQLANENRGGSGQFIDLCERTSDDLEVFLDSMIQQIWGS